jgi:hypothetical protein
MGPLWGLGTALAAIGVWAITDIQWFGAAGAWIAMVNLFNLLPINPLDGGRVFKSIVLSINGKFGLSVMVVMVAACIWVAYGYGIYLFAFLGLIGALEFFVERWQLTKVTKLHHLCTGHINATNAILDALRGKTPDEAMMIWNQAMSSFPKEKMLTAGLHYNDGTTLQASLIRMRDREIIELEKHTKNLPAENLKVKDMFKWGFYFLIITVALFYLMNSMLSIPGVDIATQFFAG